MGGWERANKYHHYYNLKKINFRKSNEELSKIFNDLRKDCLNKYFGIDKKIILLPIIFAIIIMLIILPEVTSIIIKL